jgi:hypothetical protein
VFYQTQLNSVLKNQAEKERKAGVVSQNFGDALAVVMRNQLLKLFPTLGTRESLRVFFAFVAMPEKTIFGRGGAKPSEGDISNWPPQLIKLLTQISARCQHHHWEKAI